MKNIFVTILFLVVTGSLAAQNLNRETKKIANEQVPLAVRLAYEEHFGTIPENGYWITQFTMQVVGERTQVNPVWYSFNTRGRDKTEARFSPVGELLFFKGLEESPAKGKKDKPVPTVNTPGDV